jgi:triosephosphate isomerase
MEINYPELSEQVTTALQNLPNECQTEFYLAYEPVWAIGTGKTATNSIIEKVSQFLKQELAKLGLAKQVGILYGGSVDDVSIQELVKLQQVDGFLIGGASLKPEKFKTIAQVVANQV